MNKKIWEKPITSLPVCPHCESPQWDYSYNLSLKEADYGEVIALMCEREEECGEVFYVEKVETPSYKNYKGEEASQ